jgi:hypothetical protein
VFKANRRPRGYAPTRLSLPGNLRNNPSPILKRIATRGRDRIAAANEQPLGREAMRKIEALAAKAQSAKPVAKTAAKSAAAR